MAWRDPGVEADAGELLAAAIAALRAGASPAEAWAGWPGSMLDEHGHPRDLPGVDPTVVASVAAASRLAQHTGAPLADALEAVAQVQCDLDHLDLRLEAALAGPQASARVLRWLPLGGLVLAAWVEVRVIAFMVGSPLGWMLLSLAATLWWVGQRWTRACVASARTQVRP